MRRASTVGITSSVTKTSGTHAGLTASDRGSAMRSPTMEKSAKTAGQRASGFGEGLVETGIAGSREPE
jgi:hypothetical protein